MLRPPPASKPVVVVAMPSAARLLIASLAGGVVDYPQLRFLASFERRCETEKLRNQSSLCLKSASMAPLRRF